MKTSGITKTGDRPRQSPGRGPENYIVLFFETIGVLKSPFFNVHITR